MRDENGAELSSRFKVLWSINLMEDFVYKIEGMLVFRKCDMILYEKDVG